MSVQAVGNIPVWKAGYEWADEVDYDSLNKTSRVDVASPQPIHRVLGPIGYPRIAEPDATPEPPLLPIRLDMNLEELLAQIRENSLKLKDSTRRFHENRERVKAIVEDAPFQPWRGEDERCRYHDPFREEPALYRIFADLDGTMDAIRGFANSYGLMRATWGGNGEPGECCETQINWQKAIREMQDAICLWDSYASGDQRAVELQRRVVVEKGLWRRFRGEPEPPNYCDLSAVDLLGRAVNIRCRGEHQLQLIQSHNGAVSISMVVTELLSALWIQFAIAMTERREYRRCEQCHRPFLVSPDKTRIDRRYHSEACKAKAYRLRKVKAFQLRDSGTPIEAIASQLETRIETVKKWLGEGK